MEAFVKGLMRLPSGARAYFGVGSEFEQAVCIGFAPWAQEYLRWLHFCG